MRTIKKKDGLEYAQLDVAHFSLQYLDTPKQKEHDVLKIYGEGYDWFTGTEGRRYAEMLREAAGDFDYRFFMGREEFVAVRKDLILGDWETGFELAIESNQGRGRHSDRGIAWAAFDAGRVGAVTVGSTHKLTDGRRPGDPNFALNMKLNKVIGDWGRLRGEGSALVFLGADQNDVDMLTDTFHGEPFTSSWDELERWENTGHGNIDNISSFNFDGRVRATYARAVNDKEFFLFTDHFGVETGFEVRLLAA